MRFRPTLPPPLAISTVSLKPFSIFIVRLAELGSAIFLVYVCTVARVRPLTGKKFAAGGDSLRRRTPRFSSDCAPRPAPVL